MTLTYPGCHGMEVNEVASVMNLPRDEISVHWRRLNFGLYKRSIHLYTHRMSGIY